MPCFCHKQSGFSWSSVWQIPSPLCHTQSPGLCSPQQTEESMWLALPIVPMPVGSPEPRLSSHPSCFWCLGQCHYVALAGLELTTWGLELAMVPCFSHLLLLGLQAYYHMWLFLMTHEKHL